MKYPFIKKALINIQVFFKFIFMKQVLSIFLYILTAYGNAYSQNCKYKVNEKDKFTGIYTKVTVSSKIISSHTTIGEIVMKSAEISIKKMTHLISSHLITS
jgi:hypothetical protein